MSQPEILVFGSINVDLVCRVGSIPKPGETVLSPRYEQSFGGKGANQAVAAARALGQSGRVRMSGAVGDDALGGAARDNLANEGIDVTSVVTSSEPTGCAFINVDEAGENAITVASGANAALERASIGDASLVVIQMEVPVKRNLECVAAAKAANVPVILNFAPATVAVSAEEMRGLLDGTRYLVVNELEAETVAGLLGCGKAGAPVEGLAEAIAAAAGVDVIATLGGKGAMLLRAGEGASHSVEAPKTNVVDTTGAGDTLVGAFAAFLTMGKSPEEALRLAVTAASLACEGYGAQTAMPTQEKVLAAAG